MFAIPSLKDLLERSRQSFRANLKGSDAWIWPNNVYASAKVMAGLVFELFGFADYIQRQKFAITADGENLDLHGNEFGVVRRPAQPAQGSIVLTSTGDLSVASGALFRRLDGQTYRALVAASRTGAGNLNVNVIATADGKATIAEAGTSLEIVSGVTGNATAIVGSDGIADGADVEGDEQFRARILFRKRNPPHGGAASDYVLWAGEVSGVTRVFVERLWTGVGTVRVFPLMDDLYANGIAPAPEIARVAAHIDLQHPAGAIVTVVAPTPVPVNITIHNLVPDTVATREAVVAELRDAFLRLSRVAGLDPSESGIPYFAVPGSFSISWIWQAVANASGEIRHTITSPTEDIDLDAGEMAVLGTVSFTAD